MAVLHSLGVAESVRDRSRMADGVFAAAPAREAVQAQARARKRIFRATAMLVYSAGYPLLAFALWTGSHTGSWTDASLLVALGVLMSFLGWGLLSAVDDESGKEFSRELKGQPASFHMFLALYNRTGAILVLLSSYTVAAESQGWPTPRTFLGWLVLLWIPLLVAFAIPVERTNRTRGSSD